MRERASGGGAANFPRGRSPRVNSRAAKPRVNFNSTLHQSSHGWATRLHGFATKSTAEPLAFTASQPNHRARKSRQLRRLFEVRLGVRKNDNDNEIQGRSHGGSWGSPWPHLFAMTFQLKNVQTNEYPHFDTDCPLPPLKNPGLTYEVPSLYRC